MLSAIHQEFEPPEELRDSIKCFWYNRRDCEESLSSFEVLPDGYAEIIFHFGGGCSISHHGNIEELPSPFMMGLLNQPAVFHGEHRLEIIGIRCYPWVVFDLLGLVPGKSENGVHLFEHPVAGLHNILKEHIAAGRIDDAIMMVKECFMEIRSHVPVDSMLFKAGEALKKANGSIPVNQIAASAHTTVRTLERKFKQSSGHTVKDVSGLMRFEQVRNHLWLYPDSNIAGLARELGYTDQSHLSREFKRYTGITPAVFAREVRKRKKILKSDFVAFIQA
ncbi:AraC family transcriptional regulator [Chryseobacterium sp. BIGb0232]|uniref:helix-turn-helix domain-containing protein n=1 Tax=Chryseobacterium sp. BIGb0232 TaxID=2940598 RepID=UPI000F4841EB|nr:helix-turn-helix domain-containing protein [Chryseobacterium sp. BIGb0232]MCS4300731.1 AraC-like DNA-binding protein [Chryseobacterium sp. BIGb0232]ROS20389.1 AraC family transcriptional regulator [Chryseobacterium nakagawai]